MPKLSEGLTEVRQVDARFETAPSETYRQVVARLGAAQKTSKGAPAYSRFINRGLGRMFAAVAYRLGLTPNMVTAISGVLSFSAIAVLGTVPPSWWTAILITFGLVLGYALDAADGQLARLRGGGSMSGEWLDHMLDATKASSLHLAVLICMYRYVDLPSDALFLVPIGFAVVAAVMFFGMTLNDQLRRQHTAAGGASIGATRTPAWRSLLVIPTDYGVMCWLPLLLGVPIYFFWVYTFLFAANACFMLLAAFKWFNDMKALDLAKRGSAL